MNKVLLFFTALAVSAISSHSFAQEKVEKEMRKEVRMEDENGVKTLYITTTENGKVTEEVYEGEEAEIKLAEMMDGRGQTDEIKKEVEVEMIDGVKTVTIVTSRKGKMRKEVYTGTDADAKLKELRDAEPTKNVRVQKIEVREEVREEK